METAMQSHPDPDTIADEAVGQTHATPPPESVMQKENMSAEEAARRNAPAPGPEASMPEKTAAAVGERTGDAYADPGSPPRRRENRAADRALSTGRGLVQSVSDQFSNQRLMGLVGAFGLGFVAAMLLQGRR
jgi:hypothetical protein